MPQMKGTSPQGRISFVPTHRTFQLAERQSLCNPDTEFNCYQP